MRTHRLLRPSFRQCTMISILLVSLCLLASHLAATFFFQPRSENYPPDPPKFIRKKGIIIDKPCPSSSIKNLCSREKNITIKMTAIPHTATSTTDKVFLLASKQTWNTSAPLHARGYTCPDNKHVTPLAGCKEDSLNCILGKLEYQYKRHSGYNVLASSNIDIIFTTLRKSEQFVLSQYRSRIKFDKIWLEQYPEDDLETVTVADWVERAWWRHNLFTKMLATDSDLIWATPFALRPKPLDPPKNESNAENALGANSFWLQKALQRLRELPFFGLMHRLTESFELFGFHVCVPIVQQANEKKQPRPVHDTLARIVKKYFVLDTLLLQKAEPIFDELVADMRRKKEQGILCDLSRSLKEPDGQIGLWCE